MSPLESPAPSPVGRLQVQASAHDRSLYSDFVCPEAAIVIGLDGSQHLDATVYDSRRDNFLRERGFRVLRFWNALVLSETDNVIETIFEAIHRKEMDGRFE